MSRSKSSADPNHADQSPIFRWNTAVDELVERLENRLELGQKLKEHQKKRASFSCWCCSQSSELFGSDDGFGCGVSMKLRNWESGCLNSHCNFAGAGPSCSSHSGHYCMGRNKSHNSCLKLWVVVSHWPNHVITTIKSRHKVRHDHDFEEGIFSFS